MSRCQESVLRREGDRWVRTGARRRLAPFLRQSHKKRKPYRNDDTCADHGHPHLVRPNTLSLEGSARAEGSPDQSAHGRYCVPISDFVNPDVADVRVALIRQWELIADAIDLIDLSAASRCTGWTNREVLAHLYVQPRLVAKFLRAESAPAEVMGVTENLSGTRFFGELVDASAREGAALNKVELRTPLDAVRPHVLAADLVATITTLQGSISVSDYLVTRCVEAVVHGGDLVPPVPPDPGARDITSKALLDTFRVSVPELVAEAAALPVEQWIDLATGRSRATGPLAEVLPVMT